MFSYQLSDLRPNLQRLLFALGHGLDEVLVEVVLQDLLEVIRLVESNACIKVPLIEYLNDQLLMREILVELGCLHFLQVPECDLPHLEEEVLVLAHRMKDIVNELLLSVELVELPYCLNLSYDVLFEEQLEEPVVVLLLNLHLPDELHVGVHSDPEDGGLKILDLEDVLSLEGVVLQLVVVEAKLPLVVVNQVGAAAATTASTALLLALISTSLLIFVFFMIMTINVHALILLLLILNGLLDLDTQWNVN